MSLIDKNNVGLGIAMKLKPDVIFRTPVVDFEHIGKLLNDNIQFMFMRGTHDAIINKNADNEVNGIEDVGL